MTKSKSCKVSISNAMDSKEFRRLMDKHDIQILNKEHKDKEDIYTVAEDQEEIESIMVESSCAWDFA